MCLQHNHLARFPLRFRRYNTLQSIADKKSANRFMASTHRETHPPARKLPNREAPAYVDDRSLERRARQEAGRDERSESIYSSAFFIPASIFSNNSFP